MGNFFNFSGHSIVLVLVLSPSIFVGCKNGVQWILEAWPRSFLYNGGVDTDDVHTMRGMYCQNHDICPVVPWYDSHNYTLPVACLVLLLMVPVYIFPRFNLDLAPACFLQWVGEFCHMHHIGYTGEGFTCWQLLLFWLIHTLISEW